MGLERSYSNWFSICGGEVGHCRVVEREHDRKERHSVALIWGVVDACD